MPHLSKKAWPELVLSSSSESYDPLLERMSSNAEDPLSLLTLPSFTMIDVVFTQRRAGDVAHTTHTRLERKRKKDFIYPIISLFEKKNYVATIIIIMFSEPNLTNIFNGYCYWLLYIWTYIFFLFLVLKFCCQ